MIWPRLGRDYEFPSIQPYPCVEKPTQEPHVPSAEEEIGVVPPVNLNSISDTHVPSVEEVIETIRSTNEDYSRRRESFEAQVKASMVDM
mgnify:FL=1